MDKYVCNVCGYVYDQQREILIMGWTLEPNLRTCRMIGYVLCAGQKKTSLQKRNKEDVLPWVKR